MYPPHHLASTSTPVDVQTAPSPAQLAAWDDLVTSTPGTDVNQLSVWARVRSFEGFTAAYLFARRDGRLLGGALVLLRRVPGVGHVGYCSYGPLIAGHVEDRAEVVEQLSSAMSRLRGVQMLFVQPAENCEDVRAALLRHGFRPSTAGIAPIGSVRLDLSVGLDEIRGALPPRLRSFIRRWPAAGVAVRQGDLEDIPVLARLMGTAAEARGYSRPPRPEYLRHLYSELSRTGNAAMFIGEVRGVPATADVVTMCGSMVRGRLSGFDRTGDGGRLSVPTAARWEIIQWGKGLGYRWLDFGGLKEATLADVLDRGIQHSDGWSGSDLAKLKFGGEAFRYPGPVELVRSRVVRRAYDSATASAWGRSLLQRAKVDLRSRDRRTVAAVLGRGPRRRTTSPPPPARPDSCAPFDPMGNRP
jgi:lipid II:glycine glycyltransferase (peptidoglycan interpeptide bridge formation enzyme)